MEKVQLSIEAIDDEIKICLDQISHFQTIFDDLRERSKTLTNRIEVLRAISERLPEGGARLMNERNIEAEDQKRLELEQEMSKQIRHIKNYEEILDCLVKLKHEMIDSQ